MSDAAQPAAEQAPKKSKKVVLTLVVVVLGVVLGGGAGAYLAGPLLAGSAPKAAAGDSADHATAGEHDAEGAEGEGGGATVHLVENMVLNPAASGGSRFLLLSVGFGVKDEAGAKVLEARDPELRDVVIRFLGAYTVDQLVDITRRDSLKVGLRTAVTERFGAGAVREVYFPQFVVQ